MSFVTFEEFAAVDEPGAEPLASGADGGSVIPAGALVVVYGNGGAGKTTLFVDAAFHFAAGRAWLGIITPARRLKVAWVENEGPRPEFRKKLAAKITAWDGGAVTGNLSTWHEPWEQFSFRNDVARERLIEHVNANGIDLVIAGPVKSIGMIGAGTDDDIGDFLGFVNDVRAQTGATVCLIHHENRAGQISGAWESRPDTLIHVQAQGHGRTRVFWQKVRWCSDLHGRSTQLTWAAGAGFTVDEKPEVTEDTIADGILEAVRDTPGASWSKIREQVTGKAIEAARIRDRLLAAGAIVNTATRDGHFNLWLPDDPNSEPFPRGNGSGTALVPLPGRGVGAEPFPRSPVLRNGDGNGTADDPGDAELERLAELAHEAGLA